MRKHKGKIMCLVLLLLLFFTLPGCSGKEEKTKQGLTEKIIAEDIQPGNLFVIKTEKGYYYYKYAQEVPAFCYVDVATGKEIYLCNKPECKHDGNSFCIASNKRYKIDQFCLYSGRIFATAVEETDTQYLWKLLAIALDGSEMSEIATYMTMDKAAEEKEGQKPMLYGGWLPIHRNKVFISIKTNDKWDLDDTAQYGTAILDLDTRKASYLDEEPLSRNNIPVSGIRAYGDYIYYCRREGRKTVLHQYCVKDGTEESCKLQPGFLGVYLILDEDNIMYKRSEGNTLYLYHPSTGGTEEAKKLPDVTLQFPDGYTLPISFDIAALMTDGTYIYAIQQSVDMLETDEESPKENQQPVSKERNIYVMDRDLKDVAMVNVGPLFPEGLDDSMLYSSRLGNWSFLGEEIYALLYENTKEGQTSMIYKCNRSDLLEGKPEFKFIYKKQ